MDGRGTRSEAEIVTSICGFDWPALSRTELMDAAWAYYFFSMQFRENLMVARELFPEDKKLRALEAEECDTANLSPYPGVAEAGEPLNHDEFMRRALALLPLHGRRASLLRNHGAQYLEAVRQTDRLSRASSIVSYERGGLERVFRAMLTAKDWNNPALAAFRHFLLGHLRLDDHHGDLVSHLSAGEKAAPLWQLFHDLLVKCVPRFAQAHESTSTIAMVVCTPSVAAPA